MPPFKSSYAIHDAVVSHLHTMHHCGSLAQGSYSADSCKAQGASSYSVSNRSSASCHQVQAPCSPWNTYSACVIGRSLSSLVLTSACIVECLSMGCIYVLLHLELHCTCICTIAIACSFTCTAVAVVLVCRCMITSNHLKN